MRVFQVKLLVVALGIGSWRKKRYDWAARRLWNASMWDVEREVSDNNQVKFDNVKRIITDRPHSGSL